MSFEELSFRQIPIWENRHRVRILAQHRKLMVEWIQRWNSGNFPGVNWESNETRISINQDMPLVARFVRLAGLSSTVSKSRREYLSSRSKFAGIDAKLDVLSDFLWQDTPGLQRQAIDLIDQAIRFYDQDQSAAWFRTFCPFFWIVRLIEWTAQFPVWLFSSIFHIDQKKANSSPLGRIVTIIFQSSIWLFTLFGGLAGLYELLSHLDWGKALLQRLGFSL